MNDYAQFVEYFKNLAASHILIKDFQHGNSERILGAERSSLAYPVLWLEDPDISIETNNDVEIWDCALVVMENTTVDNFAEEDRILTEMLDIIREVAHKMKIDLRAMNVKIKGFHRIYTLTNDNDWGWRLEFSVKISVSTCINPFSWQ